MKQIGHSLTVAACYYFSTFLYGIFCQFSRCGLGNRDQRDIWKIAPLRSQDLFSILLSLRFNGNIRRIGWERFDGGRHVTGCNGQD